MPPKAAEQPTLDDIMADEHLADENAENNGAGNGGDGDDPKNPPAPNNDDPGNNDEDDPKGNGSGGDDDEEPDDDDEPAGTPPAPSNNSDEFEEQDLYIETEGLMPDPTEDDPNHMKPIKLTVRNFEDIPDGFQYKNAREFAKFQNDYSDLKTAQAKQEDDRKSFEDSKAKDQQLNATLQTWNNETAELRKDGRLPEIKAKQGSKDYDKDPGVVAENKVYKFIVDENGRRAKIPGAQPLTSFTDAVDIMEARDARKAAKEAEEKGNAVGKQKSGYIGRSNGGGNGGSDKAPGYVRGSGMSPSDILADELASEE